MSGKFEGFEVLEAKIAALLKAQGPLIGKALVDQIDSAGYIQIWKVCFQSARFRVTNCARYYLRYDITRDDQIRLSPSVLRDFLSFTLIHLAEQSAEAIEKSAKLANKHRRISLKKLKVARQALLSLSGDVQAEINAHACAFIAGDISYFLAHEEPRLHSQVGTMVKGSDIDIIVVTENTLDQAVIDDAEKQILGFKYRALKDPEVAQEIDFIFKPMQKILGQLRYGDIHEKIACKILYESMFLFGRLDMYEKLKMDLQFSGTAVRIEADFEAALAGRQETIGKIFKLALDSDTHLDSEVESLFFFSQERLEFQ